MLRTDKSRSLYSMARVTGISFYTGFKFSSPLNSLVHEQWFRKPSKDWFYYKKEQTFWGLKGFVLEDTPVSRGSC